MERDPSFARTFTQHGIAKCGMEVEPEWVSVPPRPALPGGFAESTRLMDLVRTRTAEVESLEHGAQRPLP